MEQKERHFSMTMSGMIGLARECFIPERMDYSVKTKNEFTTNIENKSNQ